MSEGNKLLLCMGDQFNVNLSNYNVYTHTDNIFSNNTVYEAIIEIIVPQRLCNFLYMAFQLKRRFGPPELKLLTIMQDGPV